MRSQKGGNQNEIKAIYVFFILIMCMQGTITYRGCRPRTKADLSKTMYAEEVKVCNPVCSNKIIGAQITLITFKVVIQ